MLVARREGSKIAANGGIMIEQLINPACHDGEIAGNGPSLTDAIFSPDWPLVVMTLKCNKEEFTYQPKLSTVNIRDDMIPALDPDSEWDFQLFGDYGSVFGSSKNQNSNT